MIDLTPDQLRALQNEDKPARVRDPETDATYVLVGSEVYDRLHAFFEEGDEVQYVRDMYPYVMELLGREGWNDPAMDVYDELDPRRRA